MKNKDLHSLYRSMFLIRCFEERILEMFGEGLLSGTTHTCIGQEIIPVVVSQYLLPQDIVWSNHRGHGHYIARTGDIKGLLAEIMGLPIGICGGRGGSQHLCNGNFFSNGVLGSTAPIAAGMALAEKKSNSDAITILYLGDGAFGEGVVYETLNMVGLWELPLLIVVEDNQYAQTTHWKGNRKGAIKNRIDAFDIPYLEMPYGYSIRNMMTVVKSAINQVRQKSFPYVLLFNTYRFAPHSKSDDFRPSRELERYKVKDPLIGLRNMIGNVNAEQTEMEVRQILRVTENEIRRVYPTGTF